MRVAIVSTGNELREPHESLAFGEIHDCNRSMLLSLLDNPAVEVSHLGTVADCRETIAERFLMASREFDIVLSTGGMSVGEEDHVRSSVIAAGGTLGAAEGVDQTRKAPCLSGNSGTPCWLVFPAIRFPHS
ncbi:MAG: molybdopterin-binding protein [Rhodopseudomonas palustris]|nr:molybdopterin-binding protein [Rhodopseudomonas palustris]